jgi:DNA-binding CsgD family transcriptional regulator
VAREAYALDDAGHHTAARRLVSASEPDLLAALDTATGSEDVDAAVALLLAMLPTWFSRGLSPDGARTVDEVLVRWGGVEVMGAAGASGAGGAAYRRRTEDRLLLAAWRELLRAELAPTSAEVAAAVPELERLRDRARELGAPALLRVTYLAVQAARSLVERGAAERWADEGRELAGRLGDLPRLVKLETWTGMLAHQRGEPAVAARWAESALAHARRLDDPSLLLGPAGLLRGLPPQSSALTDVPTTAHLTELAREYGDLRVLDWLEPTAAYAALRAGDLHGASRHSAATLRRCRVTGTRARAGPPLMCLFLVALQREDVVWAGRVHGMLSRHMDVLRPAMPPATAVIYDQGVAALRSRAQGTGVDVDVEVLWGAALSHAEAVDTALGYAAEVGRAHAVGAGADAGGGGSAGGGAGGSTGGPSPGGPGQGAAMVPSPRRRAPSSNDQELTSREREVLDLLAAGGTNREISADLGISTKTVMHHTSSIYRKLAVRGRAEAVAAHLGLVGHPGMQGESTGHPTAARSTSTHPHNLHLVERDSAG